MIYWSGPLEFHPCAPAFRVSLVAWVAVSASAWRWRPLFSLGFDGCPFRARGGGARSSPCFCRSSLLLAIRACCLRVGARPRQQLRPCAARLCSFSCSFSRSNSGAEEQSTFGSGFGAWYGGRSSCHICQASARGVRPCFSFSDDSASKSTSGRLLLRLPEIRALLAPPAKTLLWPEGFGRARPWLMLVWALLTTRVSLLG